MQVMSFEVHYLFSGAPDPLAIHNFAISTSSAASVEPQDILHQYLGSPAEMPVPIPDPAAGEPNFLLKLISEQQNSRIFRK